MGSHRSERAGASARPFISCVLSGTTATDLAPAGGQALCHTCPIIPRRLCEADELPAPRHRLGDAEGFSSLPEILRPCGAPAVCLIATC